MKIKENEDAFKVFFIVSNCSSLDNILEYNLLRFTKSDLKKLLTKKMKSDDIDYSISVFYFEFIKKDLNKFNYDYIYKKYEATIELRQEINDNLNEIPKVKISHANYYLKIEKIILFLNLWKKEKFWILIFKNVLQCLKNSDCLWKL